MVVGTVGGQGHVRDAQRAVSIEVDTRRAGFDAIDDEFGIEQGVVGVYDTVLVEVALGEKARAVACAVRLGGAEGMTDAIPRDRAILGLGEVDGVAVGVPLKGKADRHGVVGIIQLVTAVGVGVVAPVDADHQGVVAAGQVGDIHPLAI